MNCIKIAIRTIVKSKITTTDIVVEDILFLKDRSNFLIFSWFNSRHFVKADLIGLHFSVVSGGLEPPTPTLSV